MYVLEGSDRAIVPMKLTNKEGKTSAEPVEGRVQTKENDAHLNTDPTQSGATVSQGLGGVRQTARARKQERFTALLHHLTIDLLRESYYALKRRAAPGVDGVSWQQYEQGLEERLTDLHGRVHRAAYRAQPSRRVYIPKADGRQRPLGIASLEDKIAQHAIAAILNQIYEVDFRGFSYGFRPGRSPHQALDALNVGIQRKRVNWILDADIRGSRPLQGAEGIFPNDSEALTVVENCKALAKHSDGFVDRTELALWEIVFFRIEGEENSSLTP
jgi:RNA-directed DNA polymerase